MRDPERIDRVVEQLRQVWLLVPDLRLTQLIITVSEMSDGRGDIFSLEDDEFEATLQKLAARIQNSSASATQLPKGKGG